MAKTKETISKETVKKETVNKEFKCLSHVQRKMANVDFDTKTKERLRPLYNAVERELTTELVRDENTGRVEVINKVVTRKVSDRNKGLKVNDFAVESLQAIGALDGLRFSSFEGDIDASLNNIDKLLNSIEIADAAALNNVENTD